MLYVSESLDRNHHRDVMFTAGGVRALAKFHAQERDARHPLLSPVHADYTGFAPMLIQASSTEVLRDDSRRVAMKARADGVSVVLEDGEEAPADLIEEIVDPVSGKTVKVVKQSKSLGNFFTIREVFKQFTPEALRLLEAGRREA